MSVLSLPAEQHMSPSLSWSAKLFSKIQKLSYSIPLWKRSIPSNPYKHGQHAYHSSHLWMLREDLCPLAYSLPTPIQVSRMMRRKGELYPQILSSSGEKWSKAYSELWPFCYFLCFLLTHCFHCGELRVHLCPGQSSLVYAQLCNLPWATTPTVMACSRGMSPLGRRKAVCTLRCSCWEGADCWLWVCSQYLGFIKSVLRHPWCPHSEEGIWPLSSALIFSSWLS